MYLATGQDTVPTQGISLVGAAALLLGYMLFKVLVDDRKDKRRSSPTYLSLPLSFGKKTRKKRPLKKRRAQPQRISDAEYARRARQLMETEDRRAQKALSRAIDAEHRRAEKAHVERGLKEVRNLRVKQGVAAYRARRGY